ncbi:hypothetical protein DYB25_007886 [Aphanomyces astaci]|uniref:Uncharacterized protein n=1 Tax=Aphanomyces astaci TaxID=112090 RepID=A0A397FI34_APHAT|nr:hypothetical protein DYB25_007886 [Aphanomyces astaci]RHY47881.1 hypothetical protein DYB38_010260 [Aphanomyces astaci]RHY62493.1 hypothetical protein DYB34_009568 [Aphanomyces astaci]RHY85865.1 hypothetical protein DYB26_009236 [Aphanomyces astaci]RHZ26880.1 hypothetical protein DYB31_009772 [Aphanomyces astaci]
MRIRKRSLDLADGSIFQRHHESVNVEGRRGLFNDIYISFIPHATENVVFFPGDVQHFDHVMRRGAFKSFAAYSYESMCAHYVRRFPHANVWIVKPRTHANGVSCYDNFVDNTDGEPSTYSTDGSAFLHLQLLLEHTTALFLGRAHIQLRVFATPYHVKASGRPWYANDVAAFQATCPHMGDKLSLSRCFMDDPPSLENHFDVLFIP